MVSNSFNPNYRRDVLPGMYVYILTDKGETSEGIVADVLGIAEHHSDGIKVRLQSGVV